jgi:L-fuconolactonase
VVRDLAAAFGADRLVWGSDWPVSTRFMTYRQALELVRSHGPAFTPDERAAVLGGTMARLLDGGRA